MRIQILLGLGVLVLTSAAFAGPSFDCAKAKSPSELAICRDDHLAFLDNELAKAYSAALQSKSTTAAAQRAWLSSRDKECSGDDIRECLNQHMLDRLDNLLADSPIASDETIAVGGEEYFVRPSTAEHIKEFNSSAGFLKRAERFESCERLVEVPAGRENEIYGGICAMIVEGERKVVRVCASSMTNAYSVEELGENKGGKRGLAFFAASHCMGG